jgi:transcriptional regulator with XRE-family HTH domain
MNLGQAIKMCRIRRGVSQEELARRAGYSDSYISFLEQNARDPTISALSGIARALDVPLVILFFLAAEADELNGLDKALTADIARAAFEALGRPFTSQVPLQSRIGDSGRRRAPKSAAH